MRSGPEILPEKMTALKANRLAELIAPQLGAHSTNKTPEIMKTLNALLLGLAIALTSNILGQETPFITEINGAPVVVWSIEQDKANSQLIERGYMYARACELLKKDTADYLAALEITAARIENDSAQLRECQYQNTNNQAATRAAMKAADQYKAQAKKQRRLKVISWGVGAAVILLILL